MERDSSTAANHNNGSNPEAFTFTQPVAGLTAYEMFNIWYADRVKRTVQKIRKASEKRLRRNLSAQEPVGDVKV